MPIDPIVKKSVLLSLSYFMATGVSYFDTLDSLDKASREVVALYRGDYVIFDRLKAYILWPPHNLSRVLSEEAYRRLVEMAKRADRNC